MNIYSKPTRSLSFVYDNPELNSQRKEKLRKSAVTYGANAALLAGSAVPATKLYSKMFEKYHHTGSARKKVALFGKEVNNFVTDLAELFKPSKEALEKGNGRTRILNKASSVLEKMSKKSPLKAGLAALVAIQAAGAILALSCGYVWNRRCINQSYESAARAQADMKIKAFDKMINKE